jgi:hypothetical protein
VKKNVTAIAMAVASIVSQESFGATVAASSVAMGSQVQIGCTLPATSGATVYSIDNLQVGSGGNDTIGLPTAVALNASCSVAINAMNATSNLGTTGAGKWVAQSVTNATSVGVSPAALTQSNSGYSLQAYTFVAQ